MLDKPKEDTYLVEGIVKSDITCFDELFNKYSKKLYIFSLNYLKSESEAEEIVQTVFQNLGNQTSIKNRTFL